MEAAFLSIPLRSGYPYQAWYKGVDCTLLKKANSYRVDKLRTIVLFEADFNFINKAVSRKLARMAESKKSIAREQYGSRKNHRSIEHVLNKRLCMDLLRQFKIPGIIAPTDLKSCYDRICHNIASLSMRRQGVQESEVLCMFRPLQYLEHTIRCAYGNSSATYGSNRWEVPMQGVYQGNGAGPIIWAVVSSPLLEILKEDGYGTFFQTAISGKSIRIVGYAFVDDTDLIQTAKEGETFDDVERGMQDALNLWEGLIKNTGGALAVDKCRWWGIDFRWTNGNWFYKTPQELQGQLTAVDAHGCRDIVKQLDVHETYETLGVFLAADGNQDDEIEYLHDKATEWADRIRVSFLGESEAAKALQSTVVKKLEYPLLALTLTREECDYILRPLYTAILPKTRINRHFSRAMLRAPGGLLGLEFPCLYTQQVVSHVECLLRHGGNDSITGQLLEATIEVAKTELGQGGSLFQQDFLKTGFLLTNSWIAGVWHELVTNEIEFHETTPSLHLRREHDQFLMTLFAQHDYPKYQLRQLNQCRIYLRVTCVSDLCNGHGDVIMPHFTCSQPHNPLDSYSSLKWPDQGLPSDAAWTMWRRALRDCLCCNGNLLRQGLGKWLSTDSNWGSFFHRPTNNLFVRHNQEWHRFGHNKETFNGPTSKYVFLDHSTPPVTPSHVAVAWIEDNELISYGIGALGKDNTLELVPWYFEWITPLTATQSLSIAEAIRNKTAVALTDGSFLRKGAAGFCVGSTLDPVWKGACRVPGALTDQSAYHSELVGIYATLQMCLKLCQEYSISSGGITIACDNIAAGRSLQRTLYYPNPTCDHFDVLQAIFRLLQTLPIQICYRHVEGHQSEKYPSRVLDPWAVLNEQMDALAKAYLAHSVNYPDLSNILAHNEWYTIVNGNKVCRKLKATLANHLRTRQIVQTWTQPRNQAGIQVTPCFTLTQVDMIDTSNIQKIWHTQRGCIKRFLCKMAVDQLATGRYMKRMRFWPSDKCPRCLAPNETTLHVLTCPDPEATALFSQQLQKLLDNLNNYPTKPELLHDIRALYTTFHDGLTKVQCATESARAQMILPLHKFVRGRIVTTWCTEQDQFLQRIRARRSATRWVQMLIHEIWQLFFRLWLHRNEAYHSDPKIQNQIHQLSRINREIRRQWAIGTHGLPQADRHHFTHIKLAQLLKKTLHYKQTWLQAVTQARQSKHQTDAPFRS